MEDGALAHRLPDDWGAVEARERMATLARQSPLVETRPSVTALADAVAQPPRAVFAGIGLVTNSRVSEAVPFDVLGLVLASEAVRRAVHAEHLLVLVADAHALHEGVELRSVERCADSYMHALQAIATGCNLRHMRVLRASELHARGSFARTLRAIEERAPAGTDGYVTREVADIAYLRSEYRGLVKVGWTLKPSAIGAERDERLFDTCFRSWVGTDTWFMYAKPGRVFDDRGQKAPPYVTRDVARRLCLHPSEDAAQKLADNRKRVSDSTWRGVCNHLRAITRAYSQMVRPLSGPLAERTQSLIDQVSGDRCESTGG